MKINAAFRRPVRALALAALFGAGVSPTARAATYIWRGGGANNDWGNGANWTGNAAPPSDLINTDLIFGSLGSNFPSIVPAYSIRSLTWNAGASAYFFDTGPLTLGAGGFTQKAANAQAFGASVILGADQTWTLADGAGALTFNGGVNTTGGPGNANRTLTINAATTTGGGNVINGNFTGDGSLTKTGAGILSLSGTASTYNGGTTISVGTLAFNNAKAVGTGAITLNGGELRATANANFTNNVTIGMGAAGTVSAATGANLTLTSLSLGGNLTIGVAGQAGVVGFNFASVSGISADSTLAVNAGTLRAGNSISLNYYTSNAASTTVNAGATLDLNGFSTSVKNLQGAGSITTGGTAATELSVGVGSFSGAISGPGALTKVGPSTLTLTGASTYTGNTTVDAGTLAVGSSGSVTGGNVTVNAGATLSISGTGNVSSGSTFEVEGTSANPGALILAGSANLDTGDDAYVGRSGVGSVTQSGGTFTTNGRGFFVGYNAGSSGAYTLTGGSLSTGLAFVGLNGSGSVTQSGGTFTTNVNALTLGLDTGANSTYLLNGSGSLTTAATYVSAGASTSVFTQSGASTHTTGTLFVGAFLPSANGTYHLDGGTLAANRVTHTTGTGVFNFNGGTLQARQDNTAFFQGLTTANVRGGGAVIDTAGSNVTVAQNLTHSNVAGDAALDGGLVKNGAGTLTLSGANTYTGPTVVNAGTLVFGGSTATRLLRANAGAEIDYSGITIGANLSGSGTQRVLAGGATFASPTAGVFTIFNGVNLAVGGPTTFNQVNSSGAITVAAGQTLTWNDGQNDNGTLTLNGTANTTGWTSTGVIAINNGGRLANGSSNLVLGGGSRTTINSGGTLSTASGTSIELNGALLTNNGAQTGTLNVNYGSTAKGAGSFGTVSVGDGGKFGSNAAAAGSRAANGVAGVRLSIDASLLAGNRAAFVGPVLNTVPGTINVGSLTLNRGSLLAANVQDARGTAGGGYDTVRVQGALTLNGYSTPGDQITIGLASLGSNGSAGAAANFDPGQAYVLTLVTANGGITGFDAANFQVDTSGFQNSLGSGRFFVSQDGNNLDLNFTPVPEPATWLGGALLLGAAGVSLRGRRRMGSRAVFGRSALVVAMWLGASAARAATYTWQGGGGNNAWSTAANWVGNAAPPSDLVNTDLVFGASAATFPSINSAYSIRSLTWNAGASAYIFDTGPLTLGGGGFTQNAANAQAFGAAVLLGADQTWTLADGAGALTFNGGVNTTGGPGNANRALTINAATTTGDGNVVNGNLTGGGSLTKTGAGVLTLTGTASTFTGGTNVNAGTLAFSNAGALGAGTVNLNAGELRATATTTFNNAVNANGGAVSAAPGVTLTLGNFYLRNSLTIGAAGQNGTVTLTNSSGNSISGTSPITVAAGTLRGGAEDALTFYTGSAASTTVNAGATLDLNGFGTFVKNLRGAGSITTGGTAGTTLSVGAGSFSGTISGAGALTMYGAGTLTLSGASTYTGATTVSAGTVNVTGSLSDTNVTVGAGASLSVTGTGALTGTSNNLILDGTAASPAAATFSSSAASSGGSVLVGNSANAVGNVTQSAGSLTLNPAGNLRLGNGPGSSGTYTLSGANSSLSTGTAYVGYSGVGSVTQSGGSFTTNGNLLILGYISGGSGTYTLSGGSLTTLSTFVSGVGSATFTQSGGTHTTNGGSLVVGAASLSANATYHLDGGTLATNSVARLSGTGVFNFNGGTLRARRNDTDFFQNLTTANVRGGGAVIDTAGFNVTVAQPLLHSTIAGDAALDGGLVKNGAGTLTLSGVNTFTGPLAINAGTLAVANENALGAASGGNVTTVNGGGQLLFTGSATLGRTYNLGASTLGVGAGNTLTFGGSVNGGFLAGPGTGALGNGATFNGVTTLAGSTLTQAAGSTATLNTTTIRGALTQTGGTLALNNASVSPASRVSVGGTVNTSGTESLGVITVNSGGTLANGGSSLYLGGGSRTTVNAGGTLSTAAGTSIELNGALLVNNGTQNGDLNVNYGSSARGAGFFGNVTVGTGGQFGNNGVAGGGSPKAAVAQSALPLWNALLRPAATQPFIGPRLSATPQQTSVANLTLGAGSTFNFNLQNTQGPAGTGYDLTNVSQQLTLTGSALPGSQIVIRVIGLDANGNNGAVAGFDPSQSYAFTLVQTGTGIVGYTAGEFAVNTASFANGTQGGSFAVVQQGNNLVLMFTPVPEPGTWAILLVGAGGLWLAARRRRRRMAA